MTWPIHPHLLVLRTAATVVLSLLIGQAGWAAAGLGRDRAFFALHEFFSWATLASCVLGLIVFVVLRRTAGPVLIGLGTVVLLMTVVQAVLGHAAIRDVHIFLGVLTVMMGTAWTSWTYRHVMPTTTGEVSGS